MVRFLMRTLKRKKKSLEENRQGRRANLEESGMQHVYNMEKLTAYEIRRDRKAM